MAVVFSFSPTQSEAKSVVLNIMYKIIYVCGIYMDMWSLIQFIVFC